MKEIICYVRVIEERKIDIKKLCDENNVLRMFIKNGKDEDAGTKKKLDNLQQV